MYFKEFDVRWSDLDANRHLANSAYINFMSHTRMSFLQEHGFGSKEMQRHNIGPVVFHEHVYYFKEIFAGRPIKVSLELGGLSEDGMFFKFIHRFYDQKGTNLTYCEIMGAWIDLTTRKLRGLPKQLYKAVDVLSHTSNFRTLTKEDTRKFAKNPENLES